MNAHSVFTEEELHAAIAEWKKALLRCAAGKSYTIDGQTMTRQDVDDIRRMLTFLSGELAALKGASPTVFARPRFVR